MTNSILTKSRKLFDESNEILLSVHQHLQGYYRTAAMVDAVLNEEIGKSLDEKAQKILKMFNQGQLSNAGRVMTLFKKLDTMDEMLLNTEMMSRYLERFELSDTARKSAKYYGTSTSNGLFKMMEERYLPVWYYYRALCAIYVTGIFQTDYAILLSYLGKPPVPSQLNEYITDLARHVGMELTGRVVPLTGIVESLLDMSKAQLDSELEKIRSAHTAWDRLFIMTDHLSLFSAHILVADCVLEFASRYMAENEKSFLMAKEYFS